MKYFKIFFTMVAAVALTACNDELPVVDNGASVERPDCPTISLPLDIMVAREDGNTTSRALEDSETGIDATIHDVWVLQFERSLVDAATTDNDAIADDARLVYWDYIPEYDPAVPSKSTVRLAESTHPCCVVIFANLLNPYFDGRFNPYTTFGDVREWTIPTHTHDNLFSAMAPFNDALPFPENATHVLRFNGIAPLRSGVSASTPALSVPLRRNIARISIDLVIGDNLKAEDVDFTIDRMELRDVPDACHLLTNGNWREDFTNGSTNFTNEDGTPTIFPGIFEHISLAPIVTPLSALPAGIDQRITFYSPANQSGRYTPTPGRSGAAFKGIYTPGYATYFYMMAHYKKDGVICPVIYKIYLGENLGETGTPDPDYQHDFNIMPNHAYNYTITLNNIGDVDADWRVEDFGPVTFPNEIGQLSNCYILNPSEVPGFARQFNIPVARVDEFWADPELGYDSEHSNNMLGDGNNWVVDIVWSDFNVDDLNASLPEGEGFAIVKNSSKGKEGYFTVQVPHGLTGNIVIGLKKYTDEILSEYLWSWHLWITDYNPDKEVVINNDMYLFHVPNGNVCRLDGDAWTTGTYKNAVMMDRNIGALSRPEPEYFPNSKNSGVCFLYGNKNPIFSTEKVYRGGTQESTVNQKCYSQLNLEGDEAIFHAIANPDTKYYPAYSSIYNHKIGRLLDLGNSVWYDRRNRLNEYPGNKKKSIFDPSPYGWIIATTEAYNDIIDKQRFLYTTNYVYLGKPENEYLRPGFLLFAPNLISAFNENIIDGYYNGIMYWPYKDPWIDSNIPNTVIYFPRSSYSTYQSSYVTLTNVINFHTASYCGINFYGSAINKSHDDSGYCMVVRCVKFLDND